MTSPYLARAQAWCFALRTLMNYPSHAPRFPTTAWCSSSPRNVTQSMELAEIATDKACDLVHVAFALDVDEPLSVSLAVRQRAGVKWMPGVRLYAAREDSPIELLSGDDRWFIGSLLRLTASKLPPESRRGRGEQIAWRRWRHAVTTMAPVKLGGSVWVPPGAGFADAIPHEQLNIAG